MAAQLKQLGQEDAGKSILKNCVEVYGDDSAVMKNIAKLTDDPTILGAGNEAVDLNRQGVRSYQAGKLVEAMKLFRQALKLQPKNISIALNTVQALLRLGGESPPAVVLQECRNCLANVSGIPETDPRYERYCKLRLRTVGT